MKESHQGGLDRVAAHMGKDKEVRELCMGGMVMKMKRKEKNRYGNKLQKKESCCKGRPVNGIFL